ncbi:MAG TPA: EpsD family peptidyl-prolyl cis-trans isomerase, partial [Burkholderiales bacterium]|nr:EpsD family peptidyl-prolyl cis-trans isomerase [Burkholderiales bacterium]
NDVPTGPSPVCAEPFFMRLDRRVLLGFLLAMAVVGGCSKFGERKTASQVAARVNSDEITIHQINYVLAREPGITHERAARAKREILNRLIGQELAKQQAVDAKLDRSPEVLQALEFARREILARAYLARLAASEPKPTPAEIRQYYAEHPDLFARRHIYQIEQITISPGEGVAPALREEVAGATSMAQIVGWLKSRKVVFAENRGTRAAEQVPLEMLPALQSMKDGEIRVIPVHGGRLEIVRVAGSKLAPFDEAKAAPRIRLFLSNRRASEAVAKEMKRLRKNASIQYVGEFAKDGGAPESEVDATGGDPSPANGRGEAQADKDADSTVGDVERGVRGLFNK